MIIAGCVDRKDIKEFINAVDKKESANSNADNEKISIHNIRIQIDSITSLNELINKLQTEYNLNETGKAYWIGYTNLMYSIAIYSDKALNPLVNFIDTTQCVEAKKAACYTIHLIGINCKIAGRIYEEFRNVNARNALLNLLKDYELQHTIMELLIRDPWLSDIPRLFNILNNSGKDCWTICNGLLRYDLKDIPIERNIPEHIEKLEIKIPKRRFGYSEQEFHYLVLSEFRKNHNQNINIEDTVFNYNFYLRPFIQDYYHFYGQNNSTIIYAKGKGNATINVYKLLQLSSDIDYCFLGNNVQYLMKNNKLHIISALTYKKIWLDWWNCKTETYKASFKWINADWHKNKTQKK